MINFYPFVLLVDFKRNPAADNGIAVTCNIRDSRCIGTDIIIFPFVQMILFICAKGVTVCFQYIGCNISVCVCTQFHFCCKDMKVEGKRGVDIASKMILRSIYMISLVLWV